MHKSSYTLHVALGLSLALHLALLTVKLANPEAIARAFNAVPLEVVLVNARSSQAPDRTQALAQAQLAGGGESPTEQRATSPLPAAAEITTGEDSPQIRSRLQQLQREQAQLLAMLQQDLAAPLPQDTAHNALTPTQRAQQEQRRQTAQRLAEIERSINENNAKPRRRYVSPATREVSYAMYYDALRRRIEDRGTRDFPEAGGRKLYGELTMNITVDAAGRLLDTAIVQSSGIAALDERAVSIVRSAGPFGHFTAAMRRDYDQLVVTSRFRFTREDALRASAGVSPR